jgi:thiamine kinase-like enzyme
MSYEARQITAENIAKVAEWCGRTVGIVDSAHDFSQHAFIHMNPYDIAVVGDWIVRVDEVFKAFTDEEYEEFVKSQFAKFEKQEKIRMVLEHGLLEHENLIKQGDPNITELADRMLKNVLRLI